QLLMAPLGPFGEEFAALGIGIAGDLRVRQYDVVGQCQIVVAQRLAFLRDLDDDIRGRQRTADRQVEPNLHRFLLVRPAPRTLATAMSPLHHSANPRPPNRSSL